MTIVAAATLLAGCSAVKSAANGVPDPMTPEQSKAQVIAAATDVSRAVAGHVASANFSRSSCNDQGDGPFRGVVSIFYPSPADPDAPAAASDQMSQRIHSAGWSTDSGCQSHGTALKKDDVDAVLWPADASVAKVQIVLYGQCRDTTSTKDQAGISEDIALG